MRVLRQPLPYILATLSLVTVIVFHLRGDPVYSAVLEAANGTIAPDYVHAGVPFIVRDHYATQICVSTRSGRPLLPFVSPVPRYTFNTGSGAPARVRAGVPFEVRDNNGVQICISTRGGQPLLPFIYP